MGKHAVFSFALLLSLSLLENASAQELPAPEGFWSFERCDSVGGVTVVRDGSRGVVGTAGSPAGANDARLINGAVYTTSFRKFDQIGDQNGYFDGIDDRAEVPDNPQINFTDKLTISVWIRPERLTGGQNIVNKWFALDSYGLALFDGRPNFSIAFPSSRRWGESFGVDANLPVDLNQWTHLAAVFDGRPSGGGNNGAIRLYVNGAFVGSASTRRGNLQQSQRPLAIGNHPEWNPFKGRIDDLRLYRAVLSTHQIQILAGDPRFHHFGVDTDALNPDGQEFYIGHLGREVTRCPIIGVDFVDEPNPCAEDFPDLSPRRNEPCQFRLDHAQAAGMANTHGYWWLHGPDNADDYGYPDDIEYPRRWGQRQACHVVKQWNTYRAAGVLAGRNIFADIELPKEGESGWVDDCKPENRSACDRNWQALRGFLEVLRDQGFTPGVYTTPQLWNRWFGKDYSPPFANSIGPFVLWVTGCGSSPSLQWSKAGLRAALPTVTETVLGGMKAVLWQYNLGSVDDLDATLQSPPFARFTPLEAPRIRGMRVDYRCTCGDVPVAGQNCP